MTCPRILKHMKNRISLLSIILLAAVIFFGCEKGGDNGSLGNYIYPEDDRDWSMAAPEKYKFDSDKLEKLTEYVASTDVTCMMVIVGGECIYQYGYNSEVSYIASCRKSVLSMMYGKYVENGTIDLRQTVGQLIEEDGIQEDYGGLLDSEKNATVLDLITCRSGVYHPASNSGDAENKPTRGSYKRGEYFLYNNWDFNFVGSVFEQKVKGSYRNKEIYQVMQEDLAHPIGMADWDIGKQKYGGLTSKDSYYPAYYFYLSTRDMARIGYLMLRKGQWKDKQIISRKWVEQSTAIYSSYESDPVANERLSGNFDYGYMWWVFAKRYYKDNPAFEGAYTAKGAYGQYILVVPKLDMVVAWKTNQTKKCPHHNCDVHADGECPKTCPNYPACPNYGPDGANKGKRKTGWSYCWKAVGLLLEAYTEDITVGDITDDDFDGNEEM